MNAGLLNTLSYAKGAFVLDELAGEIGVKSIFAAPFVKEQRYEILISTWRC